MPAGLEQPEGAFHLLRPAPRVGQGQRSPVARRPRIESSSRAASAGRARGSPSTSTPK
ncbi:hypothetical protein ACE7GA_02595 [Roseomonas sp. CCTCC AB2023176]|uniref:hypothetical protein n=1 Tax=Roseomonas sp. CCTCC AB2023176 TaxID=3342640 RepID=UPI0035D9E4FE